ncbi:hypothetical protein Aco04nite_91420 [Winogradskya consettensis]|uniref:Uncharacterized protein n=1 Tax=Winogradskya consettensis TaxID=113560 RepID=A0A919VZ56_9ACTN|nr:hypothetical protein Aco04nite_91420 [Actinoplanes consettensis]
MTVCWSWAKVRQGPDRDVQVSRHCGRVEVGHQLQGDVERLVGAGAVDRCRAAPRSGDPDPAGEAGTSAYADDAG